MSDLWLQAPLNASVQAHLVRSFVLWSLEIP